MLKTRVREGLSYEKMMRYLDKRHPRIVTICEESKILFIIINTAGAQKYQRHSICFSMTGSVCCMTKFRKSDFTKYGSGVVIYFQFIKFWTMIMFFLSLLSAPAFIFYYSGNILSVMKNPDMKDVFTAFTIGNLG